MDNTGENSCKANAGQRGRSLLGREGEGRGKGDILALEINEESFPGNSYAKGENKKEKRNPHP